MIKLSSDSDYDKKYPFEAMGTEVTNLQKKLQLPHHISSLESRSYNRSNSSKRQILACPLSQESPTNVAWDILKYQLSDRPSQQKHLANLQSNLEHRLSVARVQGNERLVQILQEESRQLLNS